MYSFIYLFIYLFVCFKVSHKFILDSVADPYPSESKIFLKTFILVPSPSLMQALNWAASEKVRLIEVSALDRQTLYEPLVYLASRLNPPPR